MKAVFQRHALALAGLCLLTLYGCGGGGGGGTTLAPPAATTTSVPVTVIDDAIQFATVCLDKNKNGACDAGEPSGKTDAAGKVTLQVANADVGKFPILAVVGTDAVDATYGPVLTAFTMTAPADQTAVVSPLTTLVQTTVATTGVSSAEAAASLQSQTGTKVSLFQDFTKDATPEGKAAAVLARLVVVVTQQQSAALISTLGTPIVGGAVVATADLNKIIQNKVLEILQDVVTVLQNPATQLALNSATTPAQVTAALLVPANSIVADPATGLTSASVVTLVAINNQIATPAPEPAPVATASLRSLTFNGAGNWFVRGFTATAAQNTVDSTNNRRYVQRQASSTTVGATAATWNNGATPARQSDLHFNGTGWANCGLNSENLSSVRDAAGNSIYNFCNNRESGKSNRAVFDVSAKTMAGVITDARAAGYTNMSIGSNSVADLTNYLGATVFPSGSSISYVSASSLVNAPAYYPGTGNIVQQADATVAAGRTDPTNLTAPCAATVPPASTAAATLEGLIAVSTGTPCINNAATATVTTSVGPPIVTAIVSSGPRNDNWGSTSLSLGTVGLASTGGIQTSYYTTNTPLRVSFAAPNVARYYACKQRSTDGSSRNCDLVGTGSYAIASLGDARVMSFTGLPAVSGPLAFERVFVQRAGKVYFGYKNKNGVFNSARLNLAGGNALLTQLQIGTVDPETPLALTKASYAGDWQVGDVATPTGFTLIRIFSNGTSSCTDTNSTNPAAVSVSAPYACILAFSNLASGSFTFTHPTVATFSLTGTLDFLTGSANGTFVDGATTGTFVGARR